MTLVHVSETGENVPSPRRLLAMLNALNRVVDALTGQTTEAVSLTGLLTADGGIAVTTINLAGGRISFPSAQSASADANTLDDYEESQTYLPSLTFGGGSTGLTYTSRSGTYTKIGDRVIVDGLITVNSNGSSSGQAGISLPVTVNSVAIATLRIDGVTYTGMIQAYAAVSGGLLLEQVTEAGVRTAITEVNIPDGSTIQFSVAYR